MVSGEDTTIACFGREVLCDLTSVPASDTLVAQPCVCSTGDSWAADCHTESLHVVRSCHSTASREKAYRLENSDRLRRKSILGEIELCVIHSESTFRAIGAA